MDGLLLDTEGIYTEVTQDIVGEFGKVFDWTLKKKIIGRPASQAAKIIVQSLDLPITPQDYLDSRKDVLIEKFKNSQPMPGAKEMTSHFFRHDVLCHELLKVSRSQWRGAGFKPGKHCVNKLLLWHDIDCPCASRHPVTNALNELTASLIVAGLTPPENYNSLIARNTGFSLSELIDGRAGAASRRARGTPGR